MPTRIHAIGTAVPSYRCNQKELATFMTRHLDLDKRQSRNLHILFATSGIKHRYSVVPDYAAEMEDYMFFPKNAALEPFPTTSDRMELYRKEALGLAEAAVVNCFDQVEDHLSSVTHLITVSCTGMYAPGLDIDLVEHLGLNTDVERTSINFMGCYAAFNALKVANHIAAHDSSAKVLIVTVELCSLHFQKSKDEDMLLSNALFSDGSASVLVDSTPTNKTHLVMEHFYSDLALEGKDEMGWFIRDVGFEMKLTAEVPEVIKTGIGELTSKLLSKVSDHHIEHYAIHPGGRKILEVIEEELQIPSEKNQASRHVLGEYGNMSSPTVLFVLKELMAGLNASNHQEDILSFAFGPGLTLESMLLKVISV
ncbi:MAG: type III polyketide synthase [Cytophagales bacterium]|nr:type III polyketide synthase [Cytophagales bacterium]